MIQELNCQRSSVKEIAIDEKQWLQKLGIGEQSDVSCFRAARWHSVRRPGPEVSVWRWQLSRPVAPDMPPPSLIPSLLPVTHPHVPGITEGNISAKTNAPWPPPTSSPQSRVQRKKCIITLKKDLLLIPPQTPYPPPPPPHSEGAERECTAGECAPAIFLIRHSRPFVGSPA
ncbi:unnamed protein product [Pleuronectes platessa]|uniref:Uncharacterized protein n=1 Tax=Pleuronectes platessa TaxID=8262 RepID=A0A9N7UHR2_PLEPL|nr:unnamed protein product [Pleuronectes platessa]